MNLIGSPNSAMDWSKSDRRCIWHLHIYIDTFCFSFFIVATFGQFSPPLNTFCTSCHFCQLLASLCRICSFILHLNDTSAILSLYLIVTTFVYCNNCPNFYPFELRCTTWQWRFFQITTSPSSSSVSASTKRGYRANLKNSSVAFGMTIKTYLKKDLV